MYSIKNDFLTKNKILEDGFQYQGLNPEKVNTYVYIEGKFRSLFQRYANAFDLTDWDLLRKNDIFCNAFSLKMADCNIIGITNEYLSLMESTFDEKCFSKILLVAIINDKTVSEAFCDLNEDPNFKFNEFMLDCSIHFTFSHEFQHILQLNSSKIAHGFRYSENLDTANFNLTNHAQEFDADRMASFEVLKCIFSAYRKLKNKNTEKLKCMICIGLASMIITKSLFYFRVKNQVSPTYTIDKQDFYTKQFSHPHPLVRIYNILEYFHDNIENDFTELNIEPQQLLNNVLGIMKLYFDSLIPDQKVMHEQKFQR